MAAQDVNVVSGSINAAVSGSVTASANDGSIVALGATSDAPYTGSGNTTVIAAAKAIFGKLNSIATSLLGTLQVNVTGTVGNLPVSVTDGQDATQGSKSDAAWSGTGAASVVSILKKMATTGTGGGPATIADGADTAQGTTTDAAWSGTGAATIVAILKKMATTGTGGGPATIADGADVTQGAKTDTVWDGVASSASAISLLKKIALTGGSAVSISNGSDAAEGNTADAAYTSGSGSVISLLKGIFGKLSGTLTTNSTITNASIPVTGTFYQATQPVSGTVNATQATGSNLHTVVDSGTVSATITNTPTVTVGNASLAVTGAFYQATQPVSLAAALPTGTNNIGTVTIANNIGATFLASASRTTTQISADIVNPNARYLQVILDTTSIGTGSISLTINGKDPASGKYYPLLISNPITTNTTNIYRVGPSLSPSANLVSNDMLPPIIQVVVTANNSNAATYSVGYNLGGN